MIEQNYNLNTIPSASPVPIVHVSQYDKGSRTLKFKLFEGSGEYSMASVNGAKINGKKPDGNEFSYNMTIAGNVVSVDVTEQMTAVAGRVVSEIVLSGANGAVLGTANFIIEVEESPINEGVISDTDIPVIVDFVTGGTAGQFFKRTATGGEWVDYIPSGTSWGNISGNIADQTDLNNKFSEINNNLSQKANAADVTSALALKANTSDVNTALANAIKSERTARQNGDSVLHSEIESVRSAVGSPLVASTAAEMTNTNKVYVYTGSETGYTAGDWYYYNGSDWVDGGVYNSVAFNTDKTLSVEGSAADAKKTGDAVSKLNSDLDNGNIGSHSLYLEKMKWIDDGEVKEYFYDKTYIPNMYDANGTPSHHDTLAMSNMLECESETSYVIYEGYSFKRFIVIRVTYYDLNKNFISSVYEFGRTEDNTCYTFTTPKNAKYFRIMVQMSNYSSFDLTHITLLSNYKKYIHVQCANKPFALPVYEEKAKHLMSIIDDSLIPIPFTDMEVHKGYRYDSSLALVEAENMTAIKFNVAEWEKYLISGQTIYDESTQIRFELYNGFFNGSYDAKLSQPLDDYLLTIPEYVKSVYLTFVNTKTYTPIIKKYVMKSNDVPYYWKKYLDGKYSEILNAMTDGGMSCVLAFITDTHKPFNTSNYSPKLLKKIDDKIKLSAIVHGGDLINWYDSKEEGIKALQDAIMDYEPVFSKLLVTEGNHDNTPYMTGPASDILNNKKLYANLYRFNRSGFIFGNNRPWKSGTDRYGYNSGCLYGYYDDEDNKIRYLNICDYDINYDGWNGSRISQRQLDFIAETLEDVAQKVDREEWVVIPFTHMATLIDGKDQIVNFEYVFGMLEKAKNGESYVVENGGVTSEPINLNVSFSNPITIPCFLSGHTHKDTIQVRNNINCVSTISDACSNHSGTVGTITEQAFDVVVINKLSRTVKLKRIGYGDDREFNY